MAHIRELFWRPDRIDHIAGHSITLEEVEEAVFEDPSGLLLRVGPAERSPDETVYRYFGRTEAGRHLTASDGSAVVLGSRHCHACYRQGDDATREEEVR